MTSKNGGRSHEPFATDECGREQAVPMGDLAKVGPAKGTNSDVKALAQYLPAILKSQVDSSI